MMDPADRFHYSIVVPETGPWTATLQAPKPTDRKIVGSMPRVVREDFETAHKVTRTRLRLVAASALDATKREISFVVDRAFANMITTHDVLHIANGHRGGLGVSVLRNGDLVAAAGAVTTVPLGALSIRYPADLRREAEKIFQARDPEYRMEECPIEVATEMGPRLLDGGRCDVGPYEVFVVHGFMRGIECVAISLQGVCPDCAATLTAPLLKGTDAMKTRPFVEPRAERDRLVQMAINAAKTDFAAGRLDEALRSAYLAYGYDRDNDKASFLIQQIEEGKREREK